MTAARLWLPGLGDTGTDELAAARAVEAYDPDLVLGQQPDGQWAVFLRQGTKESGGQPFAVFGLGFQLPGYDEIQRKLYEHDVRRNGKELLDQLDRVYEREQAAVAAKTDEASMEVAEAISSNMHGNGVHPFPRVFVSDRRKKGRG